MAPRETENNAYAKFWGDKQRVLWYVMVFSGVVNSKGLNQSSGKIQETCCLVFPSSTKRETRHFHVVVVQ